MDINELFDLNEKPLDKLISDGGFCKIFRTIGCVGDSLTNGQFTINDKNGKTLYLDLHELSWPQVMARTIGCKAYNFSRGGMTAHWYMNSFAEQKGFWSEELKCEAYIIALGVNDSKNENVGTIEDISEEYIANKNTFVGNYAAIVQRLKTIQPRAKFFFTTMPRLTPYPDEARAERRKVMNERIREMAEYFDNSYVIDLERYAPVYDADFQETFFNDGHMNPMGYVLTAKMMISYIDYIIRHNMNEFRYTCYINSDIDPYNI